MFFNFRNGIRILMFEHPIDKGMLCLFSYKGEEPFYHGPTSISPNDLTERLRRIEAYDPMEIEINVDKT